jgi:hypothetical protein
LRGKESKFNNAIRKGVKNKVVDSLKDPTPIPEEYEDGDFELEVIRDEFVEEPEMEEYDVEEDDDALDGLGEPATAAIITAAGGVIAAILSLFKGKRNPKGGKPYPEPIVPTDAELRNELMAMGLDPNKWDEISDADKQIAAQRIIERKTQKNQDWEKQQSMNLLERTVDKFTNSKAGQFVQSAAATPLVQSFLQPQAQQQPMQQSDFTSMQPSAPAKQGMSLQTKLLIGGAALLVVGGGIYLAIRK